MNDEQFKAYVAHLLASYDAQTVAAWMAEFIYDNGLPFAFAEWCTGEAEGDWQHDDA